jgi:hypothetical protein
MQTPALSFNLPLHNQVVFNMARLVIIIAVVIFALAATPAEAVVYSGSGGVGSNLQATAEFSFDGVGGLTIVLANTDSHIYSGTTGGNALAPSNLLTGLFFNFASNPTLVPISATTTSVNVVDPIGKYWRYDSLTPPALGTYAQAIRAAGFGVGGASFGNFDVSPVKLGGFGGGIAPAGYTPGEGVGQIPSTALAQNSVTFHLVGLGNLKESDITDVRFQWGTSLTEPSAIAASSTDVPSVPEPFSIIVWTFLGAIWGGMALVRRRKMLHARRPAWTPEARVAIRKMIECR